MWLNIADNDINLFRGRFSGRLEHGIRLSDTGRHTKEDLQFAPFLLYFVGLNACQKLVRVRTVTGHCKYPKMVS